MLKKFKNTLERNAATVATQSSTYMETGKIKTKIENTQAEIRKKYTEFGEAIYHQWGAEEVGFMEATIEQHCNGIKELYDTIAVLQEQIMQLEEEKARIIAEKKAEAMAEAEAAAVAKAQAKAQKEQAKAQKATAVAAATATVMSSQPVDGTVMFECGHANEPSAKFCVICGAKAAIKEEKKGLICVNCGTTLEEGAKFCFNCGAKQEMQQQAEVTEEGEI